VRKARRLPKAVRLLRVQPSETGETVSEKPCLLGERLIAKNEAGRFAELNVAVCPNSKRQKKGRKIQEGSLLDLWQKTRSGRVDFVICCLRKNGEKVQRSKNRYLLFAPSSRW